MKKKGGKGKMANRNTFHKKHMAEFKGFLAGQGIPYRGGRGVWQELQVMTPGHGWQCIFSRADMPEHYTVQDKLYPLVRSFIRKRKEVKKNERIQ